MTFPFQNTGGDHGPPIVICAPHLCAKASTPVFGFINTMKRNEKVLVININMLLPYCVLCLSFIDTKNKKSDWFIYYWYDLGGGLGGRLNSDKNTQIKIESLFCIYDTDHYIKSIHMGSLYYLLWKIKSSEKKLF